MTITDKRLNLAKASQFLRNISLMEYITHGQKWSLVNRNKTKIPMAN